MKLIEFTLLNITFIYYIFRNKGDSYSKPCESNVIGTDVE